MQKKVFCSEWLFLIQLYSPFFFRKKIKDKKIKKPHPFEVCSCGLNFMVMGHYTIINIPENFQAFTIFSAGQQNY